MSDAPARKEEGSEPNPQRKLPDVAICRAQPAGFGDYVKCLVHFPVECEYALSFGYGYFCKHPERDQIVARTKPCQSLLSTAFLQQTNNTHRQ